MAATLLVAAALWGLTAAPAVADPAVPTNYRSTVTAVVDTDGVPIDLDVEVLGGDSYLVVHVPAGTEVDVPGYDGEPYIRIHADGTVEVNQRSPARWLNDERYGVVGEEIPDAADAEAPPAWEVEARSGTYAWHDHRIHFMSPALPAQVDPDLAEVQRVWEWEVPIEVDGREAVIQGELDWVPGPSAIVPIATLLAALAVALLAARWVGSDPLVLVAAVGVAVLAVALNLELPPGADGYPVLWALPGVAVTLWAVAWFHPNLTSGRRALLRALAAVPPVVGAVLLLGALVRPIVPGLLPAAAVRTVVAVILAAAVAALVPLARVLFAATSLDRDPEEH